MMSKTIQIILIIVIGMIILAGMGLLTYIMVQFIKANTKGTRDKGQGIREDKNLLLNINSPYQTNFFNDSAEHAKQVLFGKHFIQEYGEPQYYGNKLLDVVHKLNTPTKENIIIAIKSMCIEPGACRQNERLFRSMAEQEKVPIWFMILREAVKKVVPEFMQEAQDIQTENKIIPLYATG